jgi:hypothetical protein
MKTFKWIRKFFISIKTWWLNFLAKQTGYRLKLIEPRYHGEHYYDKRLRHYSYTYDREKLLPYINGKKVYAWKLVSTDDISRLDQFVPIIYKKPGKKHHPKRT